MWWTWVVGGLVVWLVLGGALALVIGRSIRLADRRELGIAAPLTTAGLSGAFSAPPARTRRRAVPLPTVGVVLAAAAVGLMATGFVVELTGATGATAGILQMDGPNSLPRLLVVGIFAAAAVAAVAGAIRSRDRRAWWLGVGVVAAGIASVKAGGTVHSRGMRALVDAVGVNVATVLGGVVAVAVVAALWFLSRTERRDRRRVLGALTGYAVASVGLSAVSAIAPASMAVTATFLEESGEALAGVAFLVAVLIGVAPGLVLPADWAMRRTSDADSLELPQPVAGPSHGLDP